MKSARIWRKKGSSLSKARRALSHRTHHRGIRQPDDCSAYRGAGEGRLYYECGGGRALLAATAAGGGAIGIEFAQMFHRFGVSVTVLERSSYPLDKEDRELADQLCDLLTAEGIHIETEAELQHVQKISDGKQLTYRCKDGPQQELVASARQHSGSHILGARADDLLAPVIVAMH